MRMYSATPANPGAGLTVKAAVRYLSSADCESPLYSHVSARYGRSGNMLRRSERPLV
jgi:hypothetical protein